MPAPANESDRHWQLKRLAAAWAHNQGFRILATELRLPRTPYRADLAAAATARGLPATTAVFECKQSRADFLHDSRSMQDTRQKIEELQNRLSHLTRLLGTHYPNLRQGEELFPQFETRIHAARIDHKGYAQTEKRLRTLQRQLHAGTKFEKILGWNLFDLHYLVMDPGLAQPSELPAGWGLLVARRDALDLEVPPERCHPDDSMRLELLTAMARQNSRQALSDLDLTVDWDGLRGTAGANPPLESFTAGQEPPSHP
jgi:hypothetical protein